MVIKMYKAIWYVLILLLVGCAIPKHQVHYITNQELRSIFIDLGYPSQVLFLPDDIYKLIDTVPYTYIGGVYAPDSMDCDNFSARRVVACTGNGECFGELYGTIDGVRHAICLYVDSHKRVHFIEPRTGIIIYPVISRVELIKIN